MPPRATLRNVVRLISSNSLSVVVVLVPFPALAAIPIAPQDPPAFSESPSPESSHMNHRVIFGIVFVLVLFLIIEVGYACVGSRMPFTWFTEVNNLICAASVTVMQILSTLRLFRFFEKTADAIVDASSTRGRSGGTANPSTISHPTITLPPPPVHVRVGHGRGSSAHLGIAEPVFASPHRDGPRLYNRAGLGPCGESASERDGDQLCAHDVSRKVCIAPSP